MTLFIVYVIIFKKKFKEAYFMFEDNNRTTIIEKTVKSGVSFGSVLAMVISYTNWHSVGWAIIHGLMSWIYVIYYIIRY